MQISTPIQALNSPVESSPQDGGYSPGGSAVGGVSGDSPVLWGRRTQKKSKPGIFAKLLEGLIAKGKVNPARTGAAAAAEPENSEKAAVALEKAGKNPLKAGQNSRKIQNSDPEAVSFDEKIVPEAAIPFVWQDLPVELDQFKAGTGDFRFLRREKELSSVTEDAHRDFGSIKEHIPDVPNGREGEKGDASQGVSLARPEKGASKAQFSGAERAKNPLAAELQAATAGNAEKGLFEAAYRTGYMEQQKTGGSDRENSRLSELRGRKGRDRLNIEVRDLRTGPESTQAAGRDGDVLKGQFLNPKQPFDADIELAVDLRPEKGNGEAAGKTGFDHNQSRGFEDMLAGELRGNLSTDIVRDAAVIIRNGGEGTIRLSLRPASLGDVKIRLEMAENKITGHIIVESSEALRAFERELPVLEKAFRDSGFSETNLEMSLASENSADGGNFGSPEQRQEADFSALAPSLAASRYEAETGWLEFEPSAPGGTVLPATPGRTPVNLLV